MSKYLSAIREAFGSGPDTSTLRGIVLYTKRWIEKEADAPAAELVEGCQSIAVQLEKARDDTEDELALTGETDESLAAPVEQSIEAYERLHDIILSLAECVNEEDRETVKEVLVELEESMSCLQEAQEALENWSEQSRLRCPRCGGAGADPCPNCQLELLYLEPGRESSGRVATLSREYGQVYQAYSQVLTGAVTLSKVFASLGPLKKNLQIFRTLVRSSLLEASDSAVLLELQSCLEGTFTGIDRMESTDQTRRLSDLRAGWYEVFENGIRLKELRHHFIEEFGGEDGRALVQREQHSASQQDGFSN